MILEADPITLYTETRQLVGPDGTVKLPASRAAILGTLMRGKRNVAITCDVLIHACYGRSPPPPSPEKAIENRICHLRKALVQIGAGGMIHNTRNKGWVLSAPDAPIDLQVYRLNATERAIIDRHRERSARPAGDHHA